MAALVALLVLSHTKAHARGERVSAGPGVEYMVGPDGLLYQCEPIKTPGKTRYRTNAHPGVHPEHAEVLLRSSNIREVKDYKGTVAQGRGSVPAPVSTGGVVETVAKADYDALYARLGEVTIERDRLEAENRALRAAAAAPAPAPVAPTGPPAIPAAPAPSAAPPPPPSAPPAPPLAPPVPPAAAPSPAPPASAAGDNAGAPDIQAALGGSVGKLGAAVAAGTFDKVLQALRDAEVAGKNRTSALAVIDARIAALAG